MPAGGSKAGIILAVHTYSFFNEFLIILVVATVVALTFERFKLPTVLGYLLAGVVIGPRGLVLISDVERIRSLAELGVILLMLTIGIEFSFERLRGLKKIAVLGGGAQLLVSVILVSFLAGILRLSVTQGFVLGSVIALSSTAIVLKYLIERGELDSQHGRIAVAILVFQDLAFVPLLIAVQALTPGSEGVGPALLSAGIKAGLFIGLFWFLSRFVIERFLHWVAETRNREVFFLCTVVLCFGAAWLSAAFGLSMAIGAFFAGLMLANTKYSHQIAGEIVPFRHVFVSLFFVSIGLLFDPNFLLTHFGLILLIVGLVLTVNFVVTSLVVISVGYLPRVALMSGLILAQIGEFSFLLLEAARASNAIEPFLYQIFLSAAFLTIFATPFLFAASTRVAAFCERVPFLGKPVFGMLGKDTDLAAVDRSPLQGRVILCGYGIAGRDLAESLLKENVPLVILEMNPKNVSDAANSGAHVIYGDAANENIMKKAGIHSARAVVVSFGDMMGMGQIVRVVQRLNPKTFLIVRSRFERDVSHLYELGVDMVVMEELEVSLELNRLLLNTFKLSDKQIEEHLSRIRSRKELLVEQAIFRRLID
ncbi:MAG: cation:proton antiporter [Candidatus Omnitrophica bacterium]|nr:cation:proton antiporter [Candidatus Omnitrophota bacterium]